MEEVQWYREARQWSTAWQLDPNIESRINTLCRVRRFGASLDAPIASSGLLIPCVVPQCYARASIDALSHVCAAASDRALA